MITCAKCGRDNEDHYKFCLGCGSSLAAQAPAPKPSDRVACPQCSAQITAGQRFCATCGCRVPDAAARSQSMAPTEAAQPAEAQAPAKTQHGASAAAEPAASVPAAVEPEIPTPVEPAAATPMPEPEPAQAVVATSVVEPTPAASELEPAAPEPVAPAVAAKAPADAPSLGKLVMVNPDGSTGDTHLLVSGDNIVGRSSAAAVFQRDEFLSPEHASFRIENGAMHIRDLDSLNGVYVRIGAATEVFPGDHIRIGHEILRFEAPSHFKKVVPDNSDKTAVAGGTPFDIWGRLGRISAPENDASNAFVLYKEEHLIGRERGDFTFRDDGFVSGLHARIYRIGPQFFIEDLKSSNGTYLRIRGEHTVTHGTLLLMGRQPFRVHIAD